jgi:hypothetical protein
MMTLGSSTTLSSVPVEAVAATIQGREDGAPDVRPVEAAGSSAAASLVTGEAMASADVVVTGVGTPLPPATAVGESWGGG